MRSDLARDVFGDVWAHRRNVEGNHGPGWRTGRTSSPAITVSRSVRTTSLAMPGRRGRSRLEPDRPFRQDRARPIVTLDIATGMAIPLPSYSSFVAGAA